MEKFRLIVEWIGFALDGAGVVAVVGGIIWAGAHVFRLPVEARYRSFRQDVGRAILLGLEFLVAGDIIRTVVIAPTLQNVVVLALIVLVRTFLSMTLELEIEGRWPWQRAETKTPGPM